MSDNADRILRSLQAMERGDVEAVAAQAHPDVVFVNPPYAVEPGIRNGIDGFRAGMHGMLEAFEELRFDSQRIIDLGDRVVALGMWTARGRGSSLRFDPMPYAFVVTMQDDMVIRYEWFAEHDEALRAAGLDS